MKLKMLNKSLLFPLVLCCWHLATDVALGQATGPSASNSPSSGPPASAAASNCTCPNKPPLEQSYDQAALVFVGRVQEKRTNPLKKGDVEVKFLVTRKMKGFDEVQSKTVLVYTPKENPVGKIGDCAFEFAENGEYVVFANGSPAYFKTSACTRTELLENALMDVQRMIRLYSSE